VVDGSGNGYLKTVCDNVHLNPVRAKVLAAEQSAVGRVCLEQLPILKTPRAKTTIPLAWIAQRLAKGSRGYLAWLLRRAEEN
jgi:hypothetical protein